MSSPDDREFTSDMSSGSTRENGSMAGVQERAADVARAAADAARNTADEAKRRAESAYRGASRAAADTSDAMDEAAYALQDAGHETLSQAAAALSERVRTLSSYLENRRVEDLLADARGLAQRNPGMFIAGGVALGFALSRLLKASATGRSDGTRHVS